ncbi:MAG: hypothetical protein H7X75_01830 [Burkholderiaceae bacterium]|nr:hypothetical protein [Burkholderiaceae bacterium]
MNASFLDFGSKAVGLRQRSFHETAPAMAVARAIIAVACLVGFNAAHASASEPLVDKHDFLNAPAAIDRESSTEELQKIFWMCDFAASVGDLDAGQSEQCSEVTAHLERVKFKGNSEAFLAWRRINQAMAHAQLAAGGSELSCQQASQTESRS